MTELIPGKRYRFTGEGYANEDGNLLHEATGILIARADSAAFDVVNFELLPDPLPTTPGSVVRHDLVGIAVRSGEDDESDGQFPWLDVRGEWHTEAEVAGATVLFDAGAQR